MSKTISNAKYIRNLEGEVNTIRAIVDGRETFVPMAPANTTYAQIQQEVAAGTLTIEDAD